MWLRVLQQRHGRRPDPGRCRSPSRGRAGRREAVVEVAILPTRPPWPWSATRSRPDPRPAGRSDRLHGTAATFEAPPRDGSRPRRPGDHSARRSRRPRPVAACAASDQEGSSKPSAASIRPPGGAVAAPGERGRESPSSPVTSTSCSTGWKRASSACGASPPTPPTRSASR